MSSYVLSIIGTDRAGLVEALSQVVADHGGSWQRSQMTELAGMFAGMVQVQVPPDRAVDFRAALAPLREQGVLDVTLRQAASSQAHDEAPTLRFEVVGADRPGIVHEVSHLLAQHDIGIVDLTTWTESAAMAGSALFRATAVVRLPDDVAPADLAAALEGLADDLMVDLLAD
jgi:glycine cleavage system regulatory protein